MRIAAIDIGTNSIHMVIADATVGEAFAVLDREREVVQVGRGSFHDGRLRGDAMRSTAAALRRFVLLARRHAVESGVQGRRLALCLWTQSRAIGWTDGQLSLHRRDSCSS